MASVAEKLKVLRQKAHPPVSVRRMAELLGMPLSTYSRYEDPDDFKKPFLPMQIAREVARVLADFGVQPSEVFDLAGLEGEAPPTLSKGEEAWLIVWRAMAQGQRRMLLQLAYELLDWDKADGEPDPTPALDAVA